MKACNIPGPRRIISEIHIYYSFALVPVYFLKTIFEHFQITGILYTAKYKNLH